MNLEMLIEGVEIRVLTPARAGVRVCDLTEDSRTVVPGSLFIARAGLKADGNQFAMAAVAAGAVAILTDNPDLARTDFGLPVAVLHAVDVPLAAARLAERFYGSPSSRLKLALVTGTNGKTTTAFLIWKMLNAVGRRCGLVGTVLVDDGREVAAASMTTPPAIELSRALSDMLESGCEFAALESSSHALDQRRVDALNISVGIFTNLTGDHLDYHKTMEAYGAAKARLFSLLPPSGRAIVNADDAAAPRMVRDCRAPVLRCGAGAEARAEILDETMHAMKLRLMGPWGEITASVPLIGRYNAMNVLQAVGACHAFGLSNAEISRGLAKVTAPPGRLERVSEETDPAAIFVDYAHTDDALRNVLTAVAGAMPGRGRPAAGVKGGAGSASRAASGRLWVVFGCGGDKDRTKRPRMGAAAAELADMIVVTSDNPRSEKPAAIIDEILSGVPQSARARVSVQADREKAIRFAVENARAGDVVVIAGKGHETEQVLADGRGGLVSIPFDDREVARAALASRRPRPRPAGVRRSRPVRLTPGRWAGETGPAPAPESR